MKKLILAIGLLAAAPLVFTACSSTSHIVDGVQLNGNYRVSDVRVTGVDTRSTTHTETYNDAGHTSATILTKVKLETTVFDDVTPNCFIGSEWVLPHNGNGTYTIQNNDCDAAGQRQIVWSVRTDANGQKIFQLKILNGQKARKTAEGYILNFTSTSQNGFTLMSPVTVDGQTAYVYYDFVRE